MANGDDRDIAEIRAGGDEMSVANVYTEHHLGTSQPGLTAEQRGEFAAEDDWKLTADEDDPRWYETDDDDSYDYSTPEPAEEPFIIDGIQFPSEAAAQEWARAREMNQLEQDPIAGSVLGIIDHRINQKAAELAEAQEWAQQGRAERAQVEEIRSLQAEANAAIQGEAEMEQVAEAVAAYHGLPTAHPEDVHALSEQYFEAEALRYVNEGGSPQEWANVQRQVALNCIEAAAVAIGRARISHEVLKRL